MNKKKDETIHDQIFDFLFDLQKTKKYSNIKPDPNVGELGNSLLEIGTQPALYPIGTTLEEIKRLMEESTAIQMGNEKKFATSPFTPPSELSKRIKKEREKRNGNRFLTQWTSIGGNLDAKADAALLSMFAKKFNLSGEESIELGNFYKNIKKEESKMVVDKAVWGKQFMPTKEDKDFPDLDIEFLGEDYKKERFKKKEEIINKGQDILLSSILKDVDGKQKFTKTREEEIYKATHGKDRGTWRDKGMKFTRRDTPEARLHYREAQIEKARKEMEKEFSERNKTPLTETEIDQKREEEIDRVTQGADKAVWRDDQWRFASRNMPGATLDYTATQIEEARQEMEQDLEFRKRILDTEVKREDIFNILTDINIPTEDEREQKLRAYFEDRGLDEKYSKLYTSILKQNSRIWDTQDPTFLHDSQETIYKALAFRIVSERLREENIEIDDVEGEVARVESQLRSFMNNNRKNYQVRFQRALLLKRFLDSSKSFNAVFLSGQWDKFETQGLGFTQVVKRIDVFDKDDDGKILKDKDGNPILIGSYFNQGDSVMGKLLGKLYYFHPKNLANGMFNTGELWLKLACGEDGKLNKKSLGYALYNMTPGRIFKKALQNITKPLNNISEGIRTKILNPIFNKLLRGAKKFLRKILGATGIGGQIANTILNVLGDKFEAFIIQTVQVFFMAIAGILVALFFSIGSIGNNEEENALLNQNIQTSVGDTFTNFDWESVEE